MKTALEALAKNKKNKQKQNIVVHGSAWKKKKRQRKMERKTGRRIWI